MNRKLNKFSCPGYGVSRDEFQDFNLIRAFGLELTKRRNFIVFIGGINKKKKKKKNISLKMREIECSISGEKRVISDENTTVFYPSS